MLRKKLRNIKECCFAGILCLAAQLLLNAKKLIILGNTVTAAGGAAFDLSCVQSDSQIRNGGILRLTGSVGDDGRIACPVAIAMASRVSVRMPI